MVDSEGPAISVGHPSVGSETVTEGQSWQQEGMGRWIAQASVHHLGSPKMEATSGHPEINLIGNRRRLGPHLGARGRAGREQGAPRGAGDR